MLLWYAMANTQVTLTEFRSRKAGINFVCSGFGMLLYHIGTDGVEDGHGKKANRSAFQPPLSDIHEVCTKCGRKLNFDIDTDHISIKASVPSGLTQ